MNKISLSGKWSILYSADKPELDTAIPDFTNAFETNAVPGYWEDLYEDFRQADFFESLVINPEYKFLEYPIDLPPNKSVPDMSLETIVGTFWYKRELDIPSDAEGCHVDFKCVGVQNRALVFVNGKLVGEHRGYSAPFEFDVTDFIKAGETNTFVMAVSNHQAYNEENQPISGCTSRAANRFTGGIMGDVTLEIKNKRHIKSAYVTDYDPDTNSFGVSCDVECDVPYHIHWTILERPAFLDAGKSATDEFTIVKNKKLKLWTLDDPKMYEMTVAIVTDEEVADMYTFKFGLRQLKSRDEKLFFNGDPIYLRGICEHGYYPLTVHPTNDVEYYKKVIRRLKELGFNFVRFHTWIPVEEYMIAADECGILLEPECPNNTTEAEWTNIMKFVRSHPSVVMSSMGNEMLVDDKAVEKMRRCAEVTHTIAKGVNFAPMSAIRGVEYFYYYDPRDGVKVIETEHKAEKDIVPIEMHQGRLDALGEFCDAYNSYSLGHLSYRCLWGSPESVDELQKYFKKPRLSHETCILGTFPDISLEKRYEGSRIGKTELFAGPRKMLENLGLIDKAPLYYKNSSLWQSIIRKHTFENCRIAKTLCGYDFLGDIDHHWHTSGYRVGLMNEFYELKPGVTVEGVRQYNGASVLVSTLGNRRIYSENQDLEFGISVSHYSGMELENALLTVNLTDTTSRSIGKFTFNVNAQNGEFTNLATVKLTLPKVSHPTKVNINAVLEQNSFSINNDWEFWIVPDVTEVEGNYIVTRELTDDILEKIENGADVLMYGGKGFFENPVEFKVGFPGRCAGNLATVIANHPLMNTFDHDGFCSWNFLWLMTDAVSIYYPPESTVPFDPILDVVTSYKWVRRTSALSEFRIGKGRLIISTFNSDGDDPMQKWWRYNLTRYITSDEFKPRVEISVQDLKTLFSNGQEISIAANTNLALNSNDITMKKN